MIFSSLVFNKEEPIYLQIENYIKNIIEEGMVVNNGKLPATRELGKLLGVSRNSVITAYENLEVEGVVYTIKGKGTFISTKKSIEEDGWKVTWEERINSYGKLAEKLDIVKHEIPWEGNQFIMTEGGKHRLVFYWKPLEEIKDLYLYPLFIKENILKLPNSIKHIVEDKY